MKPNNAFFIGLAAMLLCASCVTELPCDSTSCNGCCIDNVCMEGATHDLCGVGVCSACTTNQVCSERRCMSAELPKNLPIRIAGVEDIEQIFNVTIPSGIYALSVKLECDLWEPDIAEHAASASDPNWTLNATTSTYLVTHYPPAGRHDIRLLMHLTPRSSCDYYEDSQFPAPYSGPSYCTRYEYDCSMTVDWY